MPAGSTSYFTVVTHIGLDHLGRYRDTLVPDGDTWLIKPLTIRESATSPDFSRHVVSLGV